MQCRDSVLKADHKHNTAEDNPTVHLKKDKKEKFI